MLLKSAKQEVWNRWRVDGLKRDDKMKTNVPKRKNAPPRHCFPGILDGIPLYDTSPTRKGGKQHEAPDR